MEPHEFRRNSHPKPYLHRPRQRNSRPAFKAGLNVLFGASNTGKSFALKVLDFLLGGSRASRTSENVSVTGVMAADLAEDRQCNAMRAWPADRWSCIRECDRDKKKVTIGPAAIGTA